MNYKDPELYYKVDIGLPRPPPLSKDEIKKRREFLMKRKENMELERSSRKLTCEYVNTVTNTSLL